MNKIPVILMTFALSTPALAHDEEEKRLRPIGLSVGTGLGVQHGFIGPILEADLRLRSGLGVSAHVSPGALVTAGAHVWSPGKKLRLGLGASVGEFWDDLGSTGSDCAMNPEQVPNAAPEKPPGRPSHPRWQPALVAGDLAFDHDIGRRGHFSLRYGMGVGVTAIDCEFTVFPMPSFAALYRF